MTIRPIGKRLLVRKCFNPPITDKNGKVILYLDDYTTESSNYATIISVGPRCEKFTDKDVGGIVLCPELGNDMVRVENEDFVISEEDVLPAVFEKEKVHAN